MPCDDIFPGLNEVHLVGTVSSAPCFDYVNAGHDFVVHDGILDVARLSGTVDHVPFAVTASCAAGYNVGDRIALSGALVSRNRPKVPGSVHRLAVSVSAAEPAREQTDENNVRLCGHICRPPLLRETPSGIEVCEITLAVPRGYGPQDYVFCVAWNGMARSMSKMTVGAVVSAEGRFQSRTYMKKTGGFMEEHTVYEVSIVRLM